MAFLTLGIETSCDETAVAVLKDRRDVLANVVYSQAKLHAEYGGVVPEVASRDHVMKLPYVLDEALGDAAVSLDQIGLIGATQGPGLVGCLLVGLSEAKGLAYGLDVPLVGVNHLEGHLLAHDVAFGDEAPPPLIALIVSGGHTSLVHVRDWGDYDVLGQTRDDAAGEAFDKVGKLLELGYPAGPQIEQLAKDGDPKAIHFPRPMLESTDHAFSFAGLKTSVLYYLRKHPDVDRADVAASFQEAIVEVLAGKTLRAAREHDVERVAVVGGVAANGRLRDGFQSNAEQASIDVRFPPMALCTDNGAMIAAAAYLGHSQGQSGCAESSDLSPNPRLNI